MSRMPTPNYVLMEDFSYSSGTYDMKTLTAGMFMRPVELRYVPKHVTENATWWKFDKDKDVFCYCRHGFVAVPRNLLRKV